MAASSDAALRAWGQPGEYSSCYYPQATGLPPPGLSESLQGRAIVDAAGPAGLVTGWY